MEMLKSAVFSDCGLYRYSIGRIWDATKPYALFIGLNPSYADAEQDDPTLGRCMKWFTEFIHLNKGDMLTSEQHRCHNEKKKFQRRV
ncbi:DUF1643 domain-containing protein [Enterobacter sp.]|uniref:DUF1643 domain-containing protein n=1 Tax=Enterobacter sp. TaxID=42895 RepID=UPI00297001F2|nr:DUF1643 domain-containing protein [Enterobacter sp.]